MAESSKIEALNQGVRAIVTLGLVAGFIWGFVFLGKISPDVFTTVVSGIVGYWFAARQGEQAAKAALDAIAPKQAILGSPYPEDGVPDTREKPSGGGQEPGR